MERKSTGLDNAMGKLTAPDLFSLANGDKKDLSITETYIHKKINSLYGTLGINYNGWAFLDATFRNDWSSALNKENRSCLLSVCFIVMRVISDMVGKVGKGMPNGLLMLKHVHLSHK